MKNLAQITFILLFALSAKAQSAEIGAWLGGINSFNDLNTNSSFKTIRPAGGIIGKYNFNDRIGVELMGSYGKSFSADKDYPISTYQKNRNEASKTRTIDLQLAGEFNFKSFGGNAFQKSAPFTPYLSAGVGLAYAKPYVFSRVDKKYVSASSTFAEPNPEYKQMQINIPLAAGLKYELNKSFILSGEFGTRILFNDYYDGFSTTYSEQGIAQNPGTLSSVGIQRGDRSRNDVFNLFGAQLTYRIPFNHCP